MYSINEFYFNFECAIFIIWGPCASVNFIVDGCDERSNEMNDSVN